MENENLNQPDSTNQNLKKESQRSASYPAITIDRAYEFSKRINEQFSAAIEATRGEIAHAIGMSEGSISREVAACAAFGFLQKLDNGKYKLTELFTDIFQPENEKDKKIKMMKAFGAPKLYQELIAKFDNQVIPLELPNTLIKHHNITEAASKFAADVFITSAQQVGVLNDNRALKYNVTLSTTSKTQFAEFVDENGAGKKDPPPDGANGSGLPAVFQGGGYVPDPNADSNKKVPIYLTKGKVAYFVYPDEITANDIAIVKHQLEGILLRIQLDSEVDELL